MDKISELKEIIIKLKVELAKAMVPYGNCPYAYFPGINGECEDVDCNICKQNFWDKYKEQVREQVKHL